MRGCCEEQRGVPWLTRAFTQTGVCKIWSLPLSASLKEIFGPLTVSICFALILLCPVDGLGGCGGMAFSWYSPALACLGPFSTFHRCSCVNPTSFVQGWPGTPRVSL